MQISITGRHIDVTDNVKDHVTEKVERCLGMFTFVETIRVVLEQEKYAVISEVIVQAAHHIRIVAKESSENLYDAIDRSIEHAERQLRKQNDKLKDHHK